MSIGKRIGTATAIAGTLDILAAIGLTLYYGKRTVTQMLTGVASGPFPNARDWGEAAAAAGLAVHFVLMAIMAAVFVFAADRIGARLVCDRAEHWRHPGSPQAERTTEPVLGRGHQRGP